MRNRSWHVYFFVAVTATFRLLYVFVVIERGSRRLARVDVTAHPSAEWALQQLREVIGYEDRYRYLIHDRDSIFATRLDQSIRALGLRVLKSPPHCPKANAICERVIGRIRRECLDWLIPISEAHLRAILKEWVAHYNKGRPHSALGSGVPDPPPKSMQVPKPESRHRLPVGCARAGEIGVGRVAPRIFAGNASGEPIRLAGTGKPATECAMR